MAGDALGDTLRSAAVLAGVPDGAVPTVGVTVVSFLDSEGGGRFAIGIHGEADYSTLIGLLQMAAHDLAHGANPTPCEEEADGE